MKYELSTVYLMKDEIYFEIVISKLLSALHLDDYGSLAKELNLSPSAFANRKKSGSLPYEAIIKLCKSLQISLDWLFSECPSRINETLDHEIDTDLFIKISNKLILAISGIIYSARAEANLEYSKAIQVDFKDIDLIDFAVLVCSAYNKILFVFDGSPGYDEVEVINSICKEAAADFLIRLKLDVVKKETVEKPERAT